MGKNKKGRSRQISPPRQAAPPPPPRKGILRVLRVLSPTGWFWTSVSLFITVVTAYFFFIRTQISVDPDISLNPKDASATLFRFTNQGVLGIYDLKRDLSVNYMRNPAQNYEMKNVRIINSAPIIKELSSGESTTLEIPNSEEIMMPSSGHMPYTEADVTIDYSYKDLLSLGHNKSIRFQAVLGADAVVHWFHKAINE